jgi:hypothetical protein
VWRAYNNIRHEIEISDTVFARGELGAIGFARPVVEHLHAESLAELMKSEIKIFHICMHNIAI